MRVSIIGGGPAGLYLAYRLKRRFAHSRVRVVEADHSGASFGFGLVFSDRALAFLAADDPETHAAIAGQLQSWSDITIVHRGERITIDGIGFTALGRLALLAILRQRAQGVGVELEYGRRIDDASQLDDCDLLVGADGSSSLVRSTWAAGFGTRVSHFSNRFAWFGTTKSFPTLTQTFRVTELGHFNAHHYRYAPNRSTFVVEVDQATFVRSGLERLCEAAATQLCQTVFAEDLDGHPLLANRSIWRRFPRVHNARWAYGHRVLIGDALHTAHFSIGSGTRLAIEDAIALDRAIGEKPHELPCALAAYEAARRPVVEQLVGAADRSGCWYEAFAQHMRLPPFAFAMSYITRSGRVELARLRQHSPSFFAGWQAWHNSPALPH